MTLTKSIGMKKLFKYGLNFQRLKIFDHKFLVRSHAVREHAEKLGSGLAYGYVAMAVKIQRKKF